MVRRVAAGRRGRGLRRRAVARSVVAEKASCYEVAAPADARLLEDVLEVLLYGVGRDDECFGDLRGGLALEDEAGDLVLALGQAIRGHEQWCDARRVCRLTIAAAGRRPSATREAPVYTLEDGVGTVKVGRPDGDGLAIDAVMEPYRGPGGEPTRLLDSSWNTVPGNEALVGKAGHNRISVAERGKQWAYQARDSIQGLGFRLVHDGENGGAGAGADRRTAGEWWRSALAAIKRDALKTAIRREDWAAGVCAYRWARCCRRKGRAMESHMTAHAVRRSAASAAAVAGARARRALGGSDPSRQAAFTGTSRPRESGASRGACRDRRSRSSAGIPCGSSGSTSSRARCPWPSPWRRRRPRPKACQFSACPVSAVASAATRMPPCCSVWTVLGVEPFATVAGAARRRLAGGPRPRTRASWNQPSNFRARAGRGRSARWACGSCQACCASSRARGGRRAARDRPQLVADGTQAGLELERHAASSGVQAAADLQPLSIDRCAVGHEPDLGAVLDVEEVLDQCLSRSLFFVSRLPASIVSSIAGSWSGASVPS